MNVVRTIVTALAAMALAMATARANDQSIIVQSTTSTKNSGLYDHLLPKFKADTGITAHVVAWPVPTATTRTSPSMPGRRKRTSSPPASASNAST